MRAGWQIKYMVLKKHTQRILIGIVTFLFSFWGFGIIWCLRTGTRLSMDELVFELSAPLRGVGRDMLAALFFWCFLPAGLFVAAFFSLSRVQTLRSWERVPLIALTMTFLFAASCTGYFWKKLDVTEYLRNLGDESSFIEDHYVDPAGVEITFPEQKKNLIYIYLESMELTYADREDGGGFEVGCIPELTALARAGECFSGTETLNGALVPYGTTWTMAAMFAQTSGLPLKISIADNMMSGQENFFPGVTSLGDILAKEGYTQELLIGSDAYFGGRKNYYLSHGNYTIHDYVHAEETGRIPEDYFVFWGYEDQKLFEFAKEDLRELSQQSEPFHLTLLTVDTHFPDGYYCDLCRDEFPGNQYADVMACSSRQVVDFIEWIREQDFYEDTVIVLSGDHITMNEYFCRDIPEDYDRKVYTLILNSPTEKTRTDETITYSTLDLYPTTLAALGAEIEGDRLGLGANLYSDQKTLTENYGLDKVNAQFRRKSTFMEGLADLQVDEATAYQNGWLPDADVNVVAYDEAKDILTVEVDNIVNVTDLKKVYAVLSNEDGEEVQAKKMILQPDRSYRCDISLAGLDDKRGAIEILAVGEEDCTVGVLSGYLPLQAHEDIKTYIELLQDYGDIAVILASKGNFAYSAISEDFLALRKLGIDQKLYNAWELNLLGVIDQSGAYSESGQESLFCDRHLAGTGLPLHLESGQGGCSILLGEEEYGTDRDGLHVVVYDYDASRVIDSAVFDMAYADRNHPRATVDVAIDGNEARLTVTDVFTTYHDSVTGTYVRGLLWDGTHYKKPAEFDLTGDGDGTYSATLDLKGYDLTDIYLELYMFYDKTKSEYRLMDWHGNLNLIRGSLAEYLDEVSAHREDRIIILSAKDDSVKRWDDEAVESLKAMGLSAFLNREDGCASYAVITADGIWEDSSLEDLSDWLECDGVQIQLTNSGWFNSYFCSVVLDGEEVSPNETGMNIMVYNTARDCFEDVMTYDFDVWMGMVRNRSY